MVGKENEEFIESLAGILEGLAESNPEMAIQCANFLIARVFPRLDSAGKLLARLIDLSVRVSAKHRVREWLMPLDLESEMLCSGDMNYRMACAGLLASEMRVRISEEGTACLSTLFDCLLAVLNDSPAVGKRPRFDSLSRVLALVSDMAEVQAWAKS